MEIIDYLLDFWLRLYLNSHPQNRDAISIPFKILTFEMSYHMLSIMPRMFQTPLIKLTVMELSYDLLHFWFKLYLNSHPHN